VTAPEPVPRLVLRTVVAHRGPVMRAVAISAPPPTLGPPARLAGPPALPPSAPAPQPALRTAAVATRPGLRLVLPAPERPPRAATQPATALAPARRRHVPPTPVLRARSVSAREPAAPPPEVLVLEPSVGDPLAPSLRQAMQTHLGFDPGAARIHTGVAADRAARTLGAAAFTVGSHVFFAHGRFAPQTPAGRALLTHELTHVHQAPHGRPFHPRELPPLREAALEAEARAAGAVAPHSAPRRSRLVLAPAAVAAGPATPAVALLAPADPAAVPAATPPDRTEQAQPTSLAPPPGPDPRQLADDVFRLLRRRLQIEHERTGVQQWR
jgi:Domain of unknown function (DUF4157)